MHSSHNVTCAKDRCRRLMCVTSSSDMILIPPAWKLLLEMSRSSSDFASSRIVEMPAHEWSEIPFSLIESLLMGTFGTWRRGMA